MLKACSTRSNCACKMSSMVATHVVWCEQARTSSYKSMGANNVAAKRTLTTHVTVCLCTLHRCGAADYAQVKVAWAACSVGLKAKRSERQMPLAEWSMVPRGCYNQRTSCCASMRIAFPQDPLAQVIGQAARCPVGCWCSGIVGSGSMTKPNSSRGLRCELYLSRPKRWNLPRLHSS